ncbi:MAG: hypothetical protein CM1200mP10_24050 [Candidatus Neomarinimicrobiota bacterium]|nr:MAG: hypothetical protein CM1200mP10_24050 [Candidatus Neomarinimicrobiota bacterium]
MKDTIIGGQIIYSVPDDNWQVTQATKAKTLKKGGKRGSKISIYLGDILLLAGAKSVGKPFKNHS